ASLLRAGVRLRNGCRRPGSRSPRLARTRAAGGLGVRRDCVLIRPYLPGRAPRMSRLSRAPTAEGSTARMDLCASYREVRSATESLCRPLAVEDYCIQSMPDVSP